jgi:hypothetical protein
LVTDTVIAMGLDPAIAISACSDLDKITELNTIMDTAMDLEEGASPTLGYDVTLDRAIPIAMAMDQVAALDSNTDLDSNTAQNTDSNMSLVQPLRDTAINSEKKEWIWFWIQILLQIRVQIRFQFNLKLQL